MQGTYSYEDAWQWLWRTGFDMAETNKMTPVEKSWYNFTTGRTDVCYERVKKQLAVGIQSAQLEWAKRITENDIKVLSGDAKYSREAPAADITALNCLRGHIKPGQFITKIRKVFIKAEMNRDIVFKPATFAGEPDKTDYYSALPSSPP